MSFANDGFLLLPGLLREDQCRVAREKLESAYAAGRAEGKYKPKASTTVNMHNLHLKDPYFIGLLDNPRIEELIKPLLNDSRYKSVAESEANYILCEYVGRSSGPKGLPLHIDFYTPSIDPQPSMVTILIAMEDRGVAEGCTIVAPGTHLTGKLPEGDVTAQLVPLKAGDALVLHGGVWHGAYGRKSESLGWAVLMVFTRWWVIQTYDMPAMMPESMKATLTPKQLTLFGFSKRPLTAEDDGPRQNYGA